MRYTFLFAAVLILVSGFIAYFGDLLGRLMGKRRLTLWRLRPRHTAYIVTAITGMLIAGLTLATLISVNKPFNRIWNEGDRIIAKNKALSLENHRLAFTNKNLQDRSAGLRRQIAEKQNEVDEAQERLLKAAEAQVKTAQAQKNAEKTVENLRKDIEGKKRELEALRRNSASAKEELRLKTALLKNTQARLASAQIRLTAAMSRQGKALDDLKKTNQQIADQQKALASLQDDLREQQKRLVEEGVKAIRFEQQAAQLLGGDIRVRQGDEIVRGTISPKQSSFSIKADLLSLLGAASDKAAKLGAGIGPNGRAVAVAFPRAMIVRGEPKPLTERGRVQFLVDSIAASSLKDREALVQVVCVENSLAGDQVPVKLVLYSNERVYRKGDLIASTTINGRLSEGRVLLAVINFLQTEVSLAGLKSGIVPIANPDSRASTGADPRTQIEGLMSVVDQIKAKGTRVKVEAFTCADVYAVGPLNMNNMRFGVSKVD